MHVAGQPGLVRLHEIDIADKYHGVHTMSLRNTVL